MSSAAAYLAVSFVILQLAEILFPAFNLGPSSLRVLLGAEIALFPVVLALSWVFDVTREGLIRTETGEGTKGPSKVITGGVLVSGLALGFVGWTAVQSLDPNAPGPAAPDASIAVLPFADLSASGDQAYLGDGLAEEILNILAGVDGLQVAARTSSFSFRENDDVRSIGDQLGVATLLEGSIRRDNLNVRVTAQLIDTQTGFHLWSQNFDRELNDLFAVQDEIAKAIAQALLGELDIEGGPAPQRYAASQEAQEAYWKGRAQWDRRFGGGIPEAVRFFTQAVELDSLYAQAYAGLADSWALMPQFVASVDGDRALDRAEGFALQAIQIDDDLAEPHASLGLIRALRGDRIEALASLGRAIDLNPSYAPALHWRANVLADMGRLADAEADAARAIAVDPLSPAIATDYGYILLWSGDLDGARAQFDQAQANEFGFAPALFGAMQVAVAADQPVPLQMALTQWAAASSLPVSLASGLATGMIMFRQTGDPQPVPPVLVGLARSGMLSAGTTATLHALLGDTAGTVEWLEQSIEDRSWVDQYLLVNPVYDLVRGEPGFEAILNRISGGA